MKKFYARCLVASLYATYRLTFFIQHPHCQPNLDDNTAVPDAMPIAFTSAQPVVSNRGMNLKRNSQSGSLPKYQLSCAKNQFRA